jgi:hypothetical protein
MSKVVHLSDEAHNKAKAYCKEHGLKMSDWVAYLIEQALAVPQVSVQTVSHVQVVAPVVVPHVAVVPPSAVAGHASSSDSRIVQDVENNVRSLVYKKKLQEGKDIKPQLAGDGVPVYAGPPFWVRTGDNG